MSTRANWFEHFFHGVAIDLWRQCVTPEQTRSEAAFIEKTLGKRTRLLDVPCGNGRHALELARRGCRVTGVDISADFITEAKAQPRPRRGSASFLLGDMRRLRWEREFDGAFCFGNAFGYFEHADMLRFLRGVARALKPGGRFLVQTFCAAESLLPKLPGREWHQVGDILFALDNRYLADQSCLETEGTFIRDGKSEVRKWWHHVYTVAEIRRMLEQAGLRVESVAGSFEGQPFTVGQPMLLIVAAKPGRPRARR